jgi:hypothetical protein
VAILAGLAVPAALTIENIRAGAGFQGTANVLAASFTGFNQDGSWAPSNLKKGLLPVAAGAVVHKLANMVGLNRAIADSGIKFVRI